jgi:hypothetical protein
LVRFARCECNVPDVRLPADIQDIDYMLVVDSLIAAHDDGLVWIKLGKLL